MSIIIFYSDMTLMNHYQISKEVLQCRQRVDLAKYRIEATIRRTKEDWILIAKLTGRGVTSSFSRRTRKS